MCNVTCVRLNYNHGGVNMIAVDNLAPAWCHDDISRCEFHNLMDNVTYFPNINNSYLVMTNQMCELDIDRH